MRLISTWLTGAGLAGCLYFVVAYHLLTRGDWRRNPGGRHLMVFTANLAALFALILLARTWPTYPGRAVVTVALYAALVVQIGWRCVLLHRTQHRR